MRAAPPSLALVLVLVAASCGGRRPSVPAPEHAALLARPALSPPLARRPAGRVVRVGRLPDAVAADPLNQRFAVAIHDPGRLALVDARRGRVTERVEIPVGTSGSTTPAVFLVPGEAGKRAIAVVPALRTRPVDAPQPTAAVVLGRTFVADARAGRVDVLDRGRPVDHLDGIVRPAGLAAVTAGAALAVVDAGRRALDLYDPRSLRRVATAPAGAGPTNVVALDERLYVADTAGDAVLAFSTTPRLHRIGRFALPGAAPYALAIDPTRLRLHVTLTATNTLLTLPVDGRGARPARTPTVRQPDAVAVDAQTGTVAVAGHADGVLQLVRRIRNTPLR
jgi:DNA-binding beta-propeller fold protein YncE